MFGLHTVEIYAIINVMECANLRGVRLMISNQALMRFASIPFAYCFLVFSPGRLKLAWKLLDGEGLRLEGLGPRSGYPRLVLAVQAAQAVQTL